MVSSYHYCAAAKLLPDLSDLEEVEQSLEQSAGQGADLSINNNLTTLAVSELVGGETVVPVQGQEREGGHQTDALGSPLIAREGGGAGAEDRLHLGGH